MQIINKIRNQIKFLEQILTSAFFYKIPDFIKYLSSTIILILFFLSFLFYYKNFNANTIIF